VEYKFSLSTFLKKPAQDDKSKTQNIVGRNYDLIWKVKITVDELATKDT